MAHRGAKQSPFVGKRVPLVDNGVPILYKRYTTIDEVLVKDDDVTDAVANGTGGDILAKKEKKKKRKHQEDADAGAADGNEAPEPVSSSKKRMKKGDEDTAVEALASENKRKEERREEQEKQRKQAVKAKMEESSSDDSSSDDSSSDEEDKVHKGQQTKGKVADDSSSDDSSSDEEEEEQKQKLQQHQAKANVEESDDSSSDDSSSDDSEEEEEKQHQQQKHQQQQREEEEEEEDEREQLGGDQNGGEEGTSGQGNAQEAQQIRSVMGFSGLSSKAAPTFQFGFSVQEQKQAEAEEKLKWIQLVDSVDKDGFVPRRVYVGGMPYGWEEEQIREYWEYCGEIESIDMLRFPDTGRFRGIAFISFKTDAGFEAALACDGEQCEKSELKVMRCKPSMLKKHNQGPSAPSGATSHPSSSNPRHGAPHSNRPAKVPGFNVAYVGNIAFESTLEELQALFNPYGATFIRMHTDKHSGQFKGYAHVHFGDEDGLDRAMELDGHKLHGRGMRVSYGQPKKGEAVGR